MDNTNQQDIKNNQTFRRSRHALNPAVMFYIRTGIFFLAIMLPMVILSLCCDDIPFSSGSLTFFASFSLLFALIFTLGESGSLVETVHIDSAKREIRVLRYTYLFRQRLVKIPFEGFTWEFIRRGYGGPGGILDRLRMFSFGEKKIVICEGGLTGWTYEDVDRLKTALSEVVPEDFWPAKGVRKKYNIPYEQARAENTEAQ